MLSTLTSLLATVGKDPLLVTLAMGGAALGESALGLGAVVPGETLVSLGAHALDGRPVLWLAWVVVAGAAFAGDHVGYLVGRRSGPALASSTLVRRLGVQHWHRAAAVVGRHGVAALVAGRLVPGLRTLMGPVAGALGMGYPRYAGASLAASFLWSAIWVGGGATVVRVVLAADPRLIAAGCVVGLLVVVALLVRRAETLQVVGHQTCPGR